MRKDSVRQILSRVGYLLIALLVALLLPLAVWTVVVCGLYQVVREGRSQRAASLGREDLLICSLDTDCPPGRVCVSGHCVPVPCRIDTDCPPRYMCMNERCVPAM